jgi:hypothetical protein
MSGFDEREDEFEKRFAMDETLRFKALARRSKLVGLWLAGLLGYAGAEADSYAAGLVASQVGAADPDETLFRAVETALSQGGVEMSENRIRRKLTETLAEAGAQIKAGV